MRRLVITAVVTPVDAISIAIWKSSPLRTSPLPNVMVIGGDLMRCQQFNQLSDAVASFKAVFADERSAVAAHILMK